MRLNTALELHVQPSRAQHRIADGHRETGQDREWRQPVPPAAGIGAILDLDPLHQRAKRDPLRHGGHQRTPEERDIPQMFAPHRAPAVFKSDAAKDQPQQHQDDRHIQRGHHRGIGQRENGE